MKFDPNALSALEPTQFTFAAETPLPRRKLGRFAVFLLVALRIYVLIAIPIVAYAFARALTAPPH
ncbi:MAG TPA: hypothetical protein VFA03_08805 [Acetobacteraceae bacterium]|nr:hypothetical protein [Acetobacteraceae bacterium]